MGPDLLLAMRGGRKRRSCCTTDNDEAALGDSSWAASWATGFAPRGSNPDNGLTTDFELEGRNPKACSPVKVPKMVELVPREEDWVSTMKEGWGSTPKG